MGRLTQARRPSPALVVSVIALVVAGVGTAGALPGKNSVRSDDIKDKNVRNNDLSTAGRTLWAHVDGDSSQVLKSSGGITIRASTPESGQYVVDFGRSVGGRAIMTSLVTDVGQVYAQLCSDFDCSSVPGADNSRNVFVSTGDINGGAEGRDFYVAALPK